MSFGSHMFHPRFLNTLTYSVGMVAVYWHHRGTNWHVHAHTNCRFCFFFLKIAVDMLVMYDLWIIVGTFAGEMKGYIMVIWEKCWASEFIWHSKTWTQFMASCHHQTFTKPLILQVQQAWTKAGVENSIMMSLGNGLWEKKNSRNSFAGWHF